VPDLTASKILSEADPPLSLEESMSRLTALALSIALTVAAAAVAAQDTASRPQPSKAPAATASLNINTATVADLQKLPGIGAATAGRIIEYRQKNGPFKKVEELMNVRGIGEKSFLKLKPLITAAPPRTEPIDR
jgi:competence protein ComEA